ncbi:hypothetical protein U0070_027441 [Myodes glareolus]|uniref:Uncharacterized protein n=1 Tax=Myodes glareolus TaxID=447135 RepID=A0AAW0J8R3_MYOGA
MGSPAVTIQGLFSGDHVLNLALDSLYHVPVTWLQSPPSGLKGTSKHGYQFEGPLRFGRNHVDKSLVEHSSPGQTGDQIHSFRVVGIGHVDVFGVADYPLLQGIEALVPPKSHLQHTELVSWRKTGDDIHLIGMGPGQMNMKGCLGKKRRKSESNSHGRLGAIETDAECQGCYQHEHSDLKEKSTVELTQHQ